jgi:hypothetical protein
VLAPSEETLSDFVPVANGVVEDAPTEPAEVVPEVGKNPPLATGPTSPEADSTSTPVPSSPNAHPDALSGRVVASEDGSPILGATVSFEGDGFRERVLTDVRGEFALRAPKGLLMIRAWAPGRVSTATGREGLATIALERGHGVSGQLVLPSGGAPPPPCRAWVISGDQLGISRPLKVDANGRFELKGGLTGEEQVAILAFCEGYATPLRLDWRSTGSPLSVALEARGAVRVIGATAPVSLRPAFEFSGVETGSTRTGTLFASLAPGRYEVEVEGLDAEAPLSVVIEGGRTQELDLRTVVEGLGGPTSPLRVFVRDPTGRPVSGARVVVSVAGHDHEASADDLGVAVFDVGPGPLSATAASPGRLLVEDGVREDGDRQDVTLVLAGSTVLQGQVFPNEAAHLRLTDAKGAEVRSEPTDDQGRFRLEGIPAGDYTLEVESDTKVPTPVTVSLPLPGPLHVHLGEDYGRCGHEHE